MSASTMTLTITKLTPNVGAEIGGVDLSKPTPDDVVAALQRALVDHKVIFFRDQDITTEQHLDFARRFGELEVHPFASNKPGYPEVLAITHDEANKPRENTWHSDVTWRLQPSLGSVLRAVEVPSNGGDTLFANMEAAYDGLTDEVKEQIDGAVARHDFNHFRTRLRNKGASDADIAEFERTYPNPHHPVVRTHPVSGRKSIYVNLAFTKEIVGWDPHESDRMLRHLYAQAAIPEYQCRFSWAPNSIAFWDNCSAQHYAVADYWPERRVMERVTVCGDTPR
jgi:taurine dioxygenase